MAGCYTEATEVTDKAISQKVQLLGCKKLPWLLEYFLDRLLECKSHIGM